MPSEEYILADHRRLWRRWQTWATITALGIALGFVARVHRYYASVALGEPFSFHISLLRDLPIFAIINPLRVAAVWVLADRLRFDRANWRRNAVLHMIGALLLAYVHLMAEAVYYEVIFPLLAHPAALPTGGGLIGVMPRFYIQLRSLFQLDFLWYWAILGAYYAVHYYSESQEHLSMSARLQASLMRARMQALRSQLNPHFLFNTLNTISVLSLKGERDAVEETLSNLGDLLRIALDDSRPDQIPLRQELEFIDRYLSIQCLRFGDRLTIRREVEGNVLDALVPAMILEPLVENAIKHGVATSGGNREIALRAVASAATLRLEVADSGPGFSGASVSRKGIGLANTEDRLGQLYGPDHRIEYGDGPGGGARVIIEIPLTPSHSRRPAA